MAEDGEIDIEGDFDFKLEAVSDDVYDVNELPSKSANLQPEYTNPPWMLEQGWTLDNCMDEKSKATIEKMLLEEQHYVNGKHSPRLSTRKVSPKQPPVGPDRQITHKQPWTEDERQMFSKGLELFGRSWTRIAKLITTRTSLQVKNYAQQFFKNKAKLKDGTKLQTITQNSLDPIANVLASVTTGQPTVTTMTKTERSPPVDFDKSHYNNKLSDSMNVFCETITLPISYETFANGFPSTVFESDEKSSDACEEIKDLVTENNEQFVYTDICAELTVYEGETIDEYQTEWPARFEDANVVSVEPHNTESSGEDDLEVDIDIENEDVDGNSVLQCRSTSPNSVYEKLLKSANLGSKSRPSQVKSCTVGPANSNSFTATKENVPVESHGTPELANGIEAKDDVPERSDSEHSYDTEEDSVDAVASYKPDEAEQCEGLTTLQIVNTVMTSTGEMVELSVPTAEIILGKGEITEEERVVHSEFFDSRPSKTPDRYLKIRNYIIESWVKCKPGYLNKTSVRPGLKNCGDVNCIGRIHAYLEATGTINFGCDQAAYMHPKKFLSTTFREKQIQEETMDVQLAKVDAMRPRKRRIRDAFGQWIDEKEYGGKTIEHGHDENEPSSNSKVPKGSKMQYDPFKLIPCRDFGDNMHAPFSVDVHTSALVLMDIHAHISKTEVIGMLGGAFCEEQGKLQIKMAVPCNSLSTGMQCEIDPVSQTKASEMISNLDQVVVGWYHSHPTFSPNPSIRDIDTQQNFQDWFMKGGAPFVGIIVSPYNSRNPYPQSEVRCLTVSEFTCSTELCNIPYQFEFSVNKAQFSPYQKSICLMAARELIENYSIYQNRVDLLTAYRQVSCLDKLLQSVRGYLPCDESIEDFTSTLSHMCENAFKLDNNEDIDSNTDLIDMENG